MKILTTVIGKILFLSLCIFTLGFCLIVVLTRADSSANAGQSALVLNRNNQPVRVAIYSGEGAYFRSITAAGRMFSWMGAKPQPILPQEIKEGRLDSSDILYMTGVHTEFEEGDDRDNIRWGDSLQDPDTEWSLMLKAVRWLIGPNQ